MPDLSTPVRGDVPIDIHPDALLGFGKTMDVSDTIGSLAYSAAREALSVAYEYYGKMNDAEDAVHAAAKKAWRQQNIQPDSAMRRDGQRLQKPSTIHGDVRMVNGTPVAFTDLSELAGAAQTAFNRVAPSMDRRKKELDSHRANLVSRVAVALDDPARKTQEGLWESDAIRSHVKSLSQKERLNFARAAIERGDKITVAAVLHARSYLSGLSDQEQSLVRELAARKFAPVEAAQLDATDRLIERVMNAGSHVFRRYQDILSKRDQSKAEVKSKTKALSETKA